jgi:NAD(P)-dependent dehydrogenase (short-subunit alcohol dehydrogenase family)
MRGCAVESFANKLAVVTGVGTGMGRELMRQLVAAGASVAGCDINPDALAMAVRAVAGGAPEGVTVTGHQCDVADRAQVIAFRDAVLADHGTDHVDLLFNNAGAGGGESVLASDRSEWERTFAICWGGVYHCTRAFLPLLVASDDAAIVNTSSVNGIWACLGPRTPNSAYSTAKFAVKGFTESLIVDLRVNAPHVKPFLVMPGHVGTDILHTSRYALGKPREVTDEELPGTRAILADVGLPVGSMDDAAVRRAATEMADRFRDDAPVSAAQAAATILDGVLAGQWRIIIGEDGRHLDALVRADPANTYSIDLSGRR